MNNNLSFYDLSDNHARAKLRKHKKQTLNPCSFNFLMVLDQWRTNTHERKDKVAERAN